MSKNSDLAQGMANYLQKTAGALDLVSRTLQQYAQPAGPSAVQTRLAKQAAEQLAQQQLIAKSARDEWQATLLESPEQCLQVLCDVCTHFLRKEAQAAARTSQQTAAQTADRLVDLGAPSGGAAKSASASNPAIEQDIPESMKYILARTAGSN